MTKRPRKGGSRFQRANGGAANGLLGKIEEIIKSELERFGVIGPTNATKTPTSGPNAPPSGSSSPSNRGGSSAIQQSGASAPTTINNTGATVAPVAGGSTNAQPQASQAPMQALQSAPSTIGQPASNMKVWGPGATSAGLKVWGAGAPQAKQSAPATVGQADAQMSGIDRGISAAGQVYAGIKQAWANASVYAEKYSSIRQGGRQGTGALLDVVGDIAERLPGPAGIIARPFIDAAKGRLENDAASERLSRSQSEGYDVNRSEMASTLDVAHSVRGGAEDAAEGSVGWFDRMKAKHGMGFFKDSEARLQSARTAAGNEAVRLVVQARDAGGNIGLNREDLLAMAADQKGIGINQLSDLERGEALNSATAASVKRLENSDSAEAYAKNQLHLQGKDLWFVGSDEYEAARSQAKREYVQRRAVGRPQVIKEDVETTVKKYVAALSQKDRLDRDRAIRDSQFQLQARRSRHKVNWND